MLFNMKFFFKNSVLLLFLSYATQLYSASNELSSGSASNELSPGSASNESSLAKRARHSEDGFGDFRFNRWIASGKCGDVSLYVNDKGECRACKEAFASAFFCSEKKSLERLKQVNNESTVLREIEHKNIIKMFSSHNDGVKTYLMLEYCEQGDLFDFIITKPTTRLLYFDPFFHSLGQAISFIHEKGFLHRDIKPENILLTKQHGHKPPEDLTIKICDFGLAKKFADGDRAVTCCGTPEYIAPEVLMAGINKQYSYGFPADWWSFGVVVATLRLGFAPFTHKGEASDNEVKQRILWVDPDFVPCTGPDIDEALKTKMAGFLHKDPKYRSKYTLN